MKRTTLILLLAAAVFGVVVYFLEIREGKPRDETTTETKKPAFTFTRSDVAAITVIRAGQSVTIDDHDGKWVISQPVNALADESTIDSLVSSLTSARIERVLPAEPEKMRDFGLEEPRVIVEVKLKSGEEHRLRVGEKDFSELSVYALLDEAPDVAILGSSVLTSSDKSLDDLRDRAVLGVSQFDVKSLTLKNENGEIELDKTDGKWSIKRPIDAPADESEVSSLISDATSAKATEFVADAQPDPAKYGIDKPKITLTAKLNDGSERVLTLGSKVDDNHYARNSDRPQIVKIDSDLYEKLNVKLAKLRDKQILKVDKEELTRIEIKNPNLTLVAEKDKDKDKWLIKSPADKKDKEARTTKLLDPLETKATEVLDAAPASAKAKLAKPAVEVQVTDKSGKTTSLSISSADGDDVYVSVKGRPGVYKVGKQMLDDLSFKIADVVD